MEKGKRREGVGGRVFIHVASEHETTRQLASEHEITRQLASEHKIVRQLTSKHEVNKQQARVNL